MIALLLTMTAFAVDAEGERLVDEYQRFVKDGKWVAVERTYARLLTNHPDSMNNAIHQSASRAARQRGELLLAAKRLMRCDPKGLVTDTIEDDLESLRTGTGLVMLVGGQLKPAAMPFAPDLRQAVLTAQAEIEEKGWYVGLLPVGTYNLDAKQVEVTPGFRWQDAWSDG